MTDTEVLETVRRTLNTIAVSGKDNMNKLLGCINALDSVLEAVKQASEKESSD